MTRARFLGAAALLAATAATVVLTVPEYRERLRQVRVRLQLQPFYDPLAFDLYALEGCELDQPTSLAFGPDDRLYVAEVDGMITAFDVRETWRGFAVTASETIAAIHDMPNHDDRGTPAPEVVGRLLTGIAIGGTAQAPVLFVTSSDPRLYNAKVDTNSGVVSRLDRTGEGWRRTDLVRGLPRSRLDHATHAILLDERNGKILVTQGGNTNAGARSSDFFDLPEYALAGTLLEIDFPAIANPPFDLPTLDDEDRPGTVDENDPFGGNDGKNQAVEPRDGPVRIFATGIRNAYDLVRTERGIFTIDNGANDAWGGRPKVDPASGRIEDTRVDGGRHTRDKLHRVREGGYYGHPNPVRADARYVFNASRPQSPIVTPRPREAKRRNPHSAGGGLAVFPRSTNGLVEYRGGLEHEPRDGSLLTVGHDQAIYSLELDERGTRVIDKRLLATKLRFLPLDVTARSSEQSFPGTIWITDHTGGRVWVFDPQRRRRYTPAQLVRDTIEWIRMRIAERAAYV